jgi:Putative Ig domain
MNDDRTQAHADRTRAVARLHSPRGHRAKLAVTAMLALVTSVATLVATGEPASASTLNGVAIISKPGTTTPLTSGGSTTQFTVSLPAKAACDGDTATGGYHVYSYFVKKGTNLSTVTFIGHPSVGSGLFESDGKYYGPVNTAVTTGQITGIPNDFEFSELLTHGMTLSALLYTGSGSTASGIWETGIACAKSSGALADNWNTEATFKASSSDPDKFVWTDVPFLITTTTLGTATRGKAYSLQLKEEGGTAPFIWTNTSPKLPTGLKLSTAGKITGTVPTSAKAGTYKVGFSLKDSSKPTARTTAATLSLVVK